MFFFKKKTIYLDCYTVHNHVYDLFKIESAKKHVPSWFRNLPSTFLDPRSPVEVATLKTCTGIVNHFKSGFIIPLWTDAQLGLKSVSNGFTNNIQLIQQFADMKTQSQIHSQTQIGNDFMPEETYLHFKIYSPWVFSCSENINWMWTQPTYNYKYPDELVLHPGVLEFKYNSNVFINFAIRKMDRAGDPNLLEISAGEPLVHLIPLTDRNVEVRNHLVSKEEWQRIYDKNNHVFFFNNHAKKRNLLEKQEAGKCPFGFGK